MKPIKPSKSNLELVQDFPLAAIHSKEHLHAAQTVIDRLLATSLDDGGEMYLAALSDLVAIYEDEHCPIEPASGADMLRHLLDAKGITQTELSTNAGIAKSTISEVLAGKKAFSRQLVRKFAEYFQVDVGVLTANL